MSTQTAASHHLGTFAVYQVASGQLIHVVTVECLPGAATPSPDEIVREAILSAAHTSGLAGTSLAVLPLGPTTLKSASSYRVDPSSRTLVEQPWPKTPASSHPA